MRPFAVRIVVTFMSAIANLIERRGSPSGSISRRVSMMIMAATMVMMTLTGGVLFAIPGVMMSLFTQDAAVIAGGIPLLRIVAVSEPIYGMAIILEGTFNGVGDTKATMIIMLFSFVLFRQLYLFTVYRFIGGIVPVSLGYPAGWIMCSAIILVYYYRFARQKAVRRAEQGL